MREAADPALVGNQRVRVRFRPRGSEGPIQWRPACCSLVSFSVLQRTREIGIRIAVGAEPRQILVMILRRAFLLVGIGIFIGLPLAFSSLRVAASVLYGVSPSDPMTVAGAVILLSVVGVSAGLVPARAAARTDPCSALRQE